jgi:hypothetical protein
MVADMCCADGGARLRRLAQRAAIHRHELGQPAARGLRFPEEGHDCGVQPDVGALNKLAAVTDGRQRFCCSVCLSAVLPQHVSRTRCSGGAGPFPQ